MSLPVASVVALGAVGVAVAALGTLHALPTGLSPLANPVSEYGISRYRVGYRVLTIAMAVAGLADAVAVARGVHGGVTVVVALVVFALARAVISWAPMDLPGATPTPAGRTHNLLALVTFTAAVVASIRLGLVLRSADGSAAGALRWLGWLILAAGSAMVSAAGTRVFGLVERVLYAAILTWLVLVALVGL